jgi:hypothetical protein
VAVEFGGVFVSADSENYLKLSGTFDLAGAVYAKKKDSSLPGSGGDAVSGHSNP